MLKIFSLIVSAALLFSACSETTNTNKPSALKPGDTAFVGNSNSRTFVAMDEAALAKLISASDAKDSSAVNELINGGKVMVIKSKSKVRIMTLGKFAHIQMLDGELQGLKVWVTETMLRPA
jgi:hypothetical protein